MEREVDVHIAVTLVCAATTSSGVPFGAQIAWLSMSSSGCPFDVTRVADVIQFAVTQGDGAPLTLNAQPATAYGALIVAVGCPLTETRGFGTVGCACPP
jgi:hypothetical protein